MEKKKRFRPHLFGSFYEGAFWCFRSHLSNTLSGWQLQLSAGRRASRASAKTVEDNKHQQTKKQQNWEISVARHHGWGVCCVQPTIFFVGTKGLWSKRNHNCVTTYCWWKKFLAPINNPIISYLAVHSDSYGVLCIRSSAAWVRDPLASLGRHKRTWGAVRWKSVSEVGTCDVGSPSQKGTSLVF